MFSQIPSLEQYTYKMPGKNIAIPKNVSIPKNGELIRDRGCPGGSLRLLLSARNQDQVCQVVNSGLDQVFARWILATQNW